MTPEFTPIDPTLEQAMNEIRDAGPEDGVVEAAAARVWAHLSVEIHAHVSDVPAADHIRSCADFQALIPEHRAGRLSEARTLLLKDHLHQCVACRRVFEGRVVTMPAARVERRAPHTLRWAAAAVVVAAAGVSVWVAMNSNGAHTGRAFVQAVNGTLFEVTAAGLKPMQMGQDMPDGVELLTAGDSGAMLQLRDGSVVEMRERSSLSTSSGSDITVHLGRGSVIVQAAHRSSGHLYVDTSDCRVAVTGTLFGVTSGVKGSRVSVVQGEVHVTQDNQEKILHAGDQTVTNTSVEPAPIRDEIAWSRNQESMLRLLSSSLKQVQMPALRYSSKLLARVPSDTALFISIPNLSQYLADAESVLGKKLQANPQLQTMWNPHLSLIVEMVRSGSEYLGDEIDIVSTGKNAPVMLAEPRKEGFAEFLKAKNVNLTVESRPGILIFGPEAGSVQSVAAHLDSGFASTPLYDRVSESYRQGAGLLLCFDLSAQRTPFAGARYFIAEQKQTARQTVASASLGFDGPRTGLAAVLAEPSSMGALDFMSPEATAVAAFVVQNPQAAVDAILAVPQGSLAAAQKSLADERQEKGFDVRSDLAGSMGSEFAFAIDGSLMPVPSWKLVMEVYDPAKLQASLQKFVETHNRDAARTGKPPLVTGQEIVDGRTYYSLAQSNSGPLMEAHYTFEQGYLVAGPTRALVARALQIKTAGTSIKHSARFLELTPRDQHLNFSALIYQNMGNTLAPLAGLAASFIPKGVGGHNPLAAITDIKPALYAVYAEPTRITMTANGDVLGSTLSSLMSGNILGLTGIPLPMQMMGTRAPHRAYSEK